MTENLTLLAKEVSKEMISEIRGNPDKIYFPFFGEGDNILKNGFKLDRVMFKIPGTDFQIYWYGFLIAMGLLLALIYGFKKMPKLGIDPDRATDAVICGFFGAIIGARLYYVLFSLSDYTKAGGGLDLKAIINVRDGGLAIYGGIIGALIVGVIVAKIRKLKVTALLDVAGPCFLIGQAIGRWGNFFNVEAFGSNTTLPWGMMSESTIRYLATHYDSIEGTVDNFLPVHPCFLYESIWCAIGFVLLHLYMKHRKFDGEVFLMYIGWYGLGRFFIEGLRTDSLYFGNIRISQLIAGTCVLVSIILIIIFRGMVRRSGDYKFFYETDLSKQQLAEYRAFEEYKTKSKELKSQIKKAKANGESTAELEKKLKTLKYDISEKNLSDILDDEDEYTNIVDDEFDEIDMNDDTQIVDGEEFIDEEDIEDAEDFEEDVEEDFDE